MSAYTRSKRKRLRLASCLALVCALGGSLYAAVAAAALVFGQVSGIDSPNDHFEIRVGNSDVTVNVRSNAYEIVLPPGNYVAVYKKSRRAEIVSTANPRRQDLVFK
jgi:hypothetical protein